MRLLDPSDPMVSRSDDDDLHRQAICGCKPPWQKPKPNGTCATCGGWLPGEQPKPLPWTTARPEATR